MGYLYETHMHTSEASACASSTAREMVAMYKEAGYSGVIITDHFLNGNTCVDRTLPWDKQIEDFLKGYEHAFKAGEELGIKVFLGWEYSYYGWHFLTYGLGKEWLLSHPDLLSWPPEVYFDRARQDGGFIIHAHPYREAPYIRGTKFFPEHVDAIEVINASHPDKSWNRKALDYAVKHHFPQTSGSDAHSVRDRFFGGMEFDTLLSSIEDLIAAIKSGKGRLLGE
jgi:predicted metal-dependent phosphoesterase TrpH